MNKTLGTIACPICGEEADLRRCERGARTWYWVCRCGKITPNLAQGQQWIMDRARIFTPEDQGGAPAHKPAPEPVPKPEPAHKPAPESVHPEPVPPQKEKNGWLDW